MKAFVEHTIDPADQLRSALESLDTDVRIALTHYSPIPETFRGEPPEIYPFLGCYQLDEVIDACDIAIAIHGHAHFGCAQGVTAGGTRMRNVAQLVIRSAYAATASTWRTPPHGDAAVTRGGRSLDGCPAILLPSWYVDQ
ncbi:hypothetical protein CLV71_1282 [Actinophytocola oryzae]|uniref:Calcineurin-like phosphoesterase family protein n=1 Tax=Actinophytocola oryzae TaxID=502181 RepID=A0A4R7US78_9PSEU|nr:hypothetical protein CLV71_1282 [Actinophytocola oryzae]